MNKLSSSIQRNTFQKEKYLERMAEEGKTPENDLDVSAMLEMYSDWDTEKTRKESDIEWQKNNLEYDLRSTDWILEKVRKSDAYAQNLYACLCNNDFRKNEVLPILKEETWSCSWRYAGGIIADMLEKGDYIDWYCSGITKNLPDEDYNLLNKEDQERYLFVKNNYVGEGVVTDEIKNDLMKLGWIVLSDNGE